MWCLIISSSFISLPFPYLFRLRNLNLVDADLDTDIDTSLSSNDAEDDEFLVSLVAKEADLEIRKGSDIGGFDWIT